MPAGLIHGLNRFKQAGGLFLPILVLDTYWNICRKTWRRPLITLRLRGGRELASAWHNHGLPSGGMWLRTDIAKIPTTFIPGSRFEPKLGRYIKYFFFTLLYFHTDFTSDLNPFITVAKYREKAKNRTCLPERVAPHDLSELVFKDPWSMQEP